MAGQLKIKTTVLVSAGSSLRTVATEFEGANAGAEGIGDALGHAGLADKVNHFARGWDDRRAKMLESMAFLAEACTGIGEGFEDLDRQFAAALRGER
jgi:hypothetical protein